MDSQQDERILLEGFEQLTSGHSDLKTRQVRESLNRVGCREVENKVC